MKRSKQTTIAAILTGIFGIYNIVASIPILAQGAEAVNATAAVDNPPYFILVLALILGVVALVTAWGLWRNQRWAKIITILIMALGGLSALPGVLFAETLSLRISAIAGVVIPLSVIVLILWRSPQTAAESTTS